MRKHTAAHLTNPQIRASLLAKVAIDRANEVEILVLIAEADLRRMYADEGYSSMYVYCVQCFHFSKDVAFKRIHAARAARDYPLLFDALEDGRLHLSAVRLLATHLNRENVQELVDAATHHTCEEIEEMLARRFVRLETLLEGSSGAPTVTQGAAGDVAPVAAAGDVAPDAAVEAALMIPQQAARPVAQEPMQLGQLAADNSVPASVSPERKPEAKPEPMVWVAITKRAHHKLQYARALLSHTFPDVSTVLERGLDEVIAKAEKRKFGATDRPWSAERRAAAERKRTAKRERTAERECTAEREPAAERTRSVPPESATRSDAPSSPFDASSARPADTRGAAKLESSAPDGDVTAKGELQVGA